MRRRDFVAGLLLAAAIKRADCQEHAKPYHMAVVAGNYPTAAMTEIGPARPFFQELRRLGYAEGQNLVVDRYSGEGQEERYDGLAREVVHLKPDVIFAIAVPIALKLKAATATIPIVGLVADPMGTGLVSKLARPDSNFTCVTLDVDVEIWGKRLELLKEARPELSKVGVVTPLINYYRPELQKACQRLGCSVLDAQPEGPLQEMEYRRLIAAMVQNGADALIVSDGDENVAYRRVIVELAATYRVPTMYPLRAFAESGGFMSYGVDFADILRHAAGQVDKVLKGANPRDIPVYQATKFELVVNLKTAKSLGLRIPSSLLARADEVIE
jgi:putative tryptophan/tyrosine transport system substrate-binding protein